ncbi:MAG TPA: rhomboid family intramembrane serine protease [Myxococcaceae bacterium]|nr:rhomboid family intramembrane serine protease [Myxococcaceae bacterium]
MILPLRDSPRSATWPGVMAAIIVANALVFFWELSLGASGQLDAAIEVFGFVPRRFFGWEQAGGAPLDPWRFVPLVTANFLHGGWLHIIGNMWFLAVFGDNVEDRLGHFRFLLFYLLCGAASMLVQGAVLPTSRVPAIGASGAIAGVLGAYLVLYPSARVRTLVFVFLVDLPAVVFLGIWFLTQLLNGTASLTPGAGVAASGVAWWAHVGGFVVGMGLCVLLRKDEAPRPRRDWTTRPPRGLWT